MAAAPDQWKAAFKQILGASPQKSDYALAPKAISRAVLGPSPRKAVVQSSAPAKASGATRLKRPAPADSPLKRPPAKRPLHNPVNEQSSLNDDRRRQSPRKQLKFIVTPNSPKKSLPDESSTKDTIRSPLKKLAMSPYRSPRKPVSRNILTMTRAAIMLENKSPLKKASSKPSFLRRLTMDENDVDGERTAEEGEAADEFHDEEEFCEKEGADSDEEKTAATTPAPSAAIKKKRVYQPRKKPDGENFLKLNMRKKSFVRGKVTAEQKRKFKRKAQWKKFKGGA